jgi:hypothetical protein
MIEVVLPLAVSLSAGTSRMAIFEEPVNLAEVNSADKDKGPFLTDDALTIYFHSDRAERGAPPDIWRATRPHLGARFAKPERVLTNGTDPALSCDHLTLFLSRMMVGPLGRQEDIFRSTRPSRDAPFGEPIPVGEINTLYRDKSPRLSHDGLSLFFCSNRPGGFGNMDVWVARRSTPSGPFGPAENVAPLNSEHNEPSIDISHDGLTAYFASNRPGGLGSADIWCATRTSVEESFGRPVNVRVLNSPEREKAPAISGDGRTIVFRSERQLGERRSELYQARDARSGSVGLASAKRWDTLFVNGQAGDEQRLVRAPARTAVTVTMALPGGDASCVRGVVLGWFGPLPGVADELPWGIGALPFTPSSACVDPTTSSQGWCRLRMRTGAWSSPRAWTHTVRPGLATTVQAIVRDDGARLAQRLSVTNAVTILGD